MSHWRTQHKKICSLEKSFKFPKGRITSVIWSNTNRIWSNTNPFSQVSMTQVTSRSMMFSFMGITKRVNRDTVCRRERWWVAQQLNGHYIPTPVFFLFVCLFFIFSSTSLLLPTHLPPPSCTHAQSCNPMDFSPPDSSVHGFFQARILEWVAISFSTTPVFLSATHIPMYWISREVSF